MKKYYLNQNLELSEKEETEHVLHVEVEEKDGEFFLTSSTLTYYFEDQLLAAAKKKFPESKKINISYNQEIYLDFFSFKFFKEKIFD